MLDPSTRKQLNDKWNRLFLRAKDLKPNQREQIAATIDQFLVAVDNSMLQMIGPNPVKSKNVGALVLSANCPKCGQQVIITLQ